MRRLFRPRGAGIPQRAIGKTLQAVVDGLRDHAVFLLQPDGRIASWNTGAERLLGYAAEEAIGMDGAVLFVPEDRERNIPALEMEAAAEKGIAEDKRWHLRKDGALVWATGSMEPVRDDKGRLIGFAKVMRDDTDRKRLEEEVLAQTADLKLRADELLAAARAKDEFLATVSHELRGPLNSILGWAHILRTNNDAALAARAVETIERNARGQAKLIEDLMDMSRIIAGKVHLEARPVDLNGVAAAAIDVVQIAADARGVALGRDFPALRTVVTGDPDRLQQVVLNLLTNAVKFTPAGGAVDVRVGREGEQGVLSVADTGRGIPPDLLPFVFDRFRQGAHERLKGEKGLGLGLAIARQIVELHGGVITAASEGEGRGALFTVKLPLARVSSVAATDTATVSPWSLDGLSVVVVEDERDSREFYRVALERAGAAVHAAELAVEGLDLVRERRPDVLVSDIQMPGGDGYDLISRVRALPADEGGETPAVALTAYSSAAERTRALAAGYQMHVAKPVDPGELAAVIATLAGRRAGGPEG